MSFRASLPLLASAVLMAGCVKQPSGVIQIDAFCAPDDDAKSCAPSGACKKYVTGTGSYYLLFDAATLNWGYGFYTEFKNHLADNGNPSTGAGNTHDAWVEGVSLTYRVDVSQSASTPAFSLPDDEFDGIDAPLPAEGTSTPFINLLPPTTMRRLYAGIAFGDAVLLQIDVVGKIRLGDQSTTTTAPRKFRAWIVNDVFPGYQCSTAGDVVTAVCPSYGDAGATIACSSDTSMYAVGGTVSGLDGTTQLTISCALDGGTSTALPIITANGTYSCTSSAAAGSTYAVTFSVTSATGQTCGFVSGTGAGTVGNADVAVDIQCR